MIAAGELCENCNRDFCNLPEIGGLAVKCVRCDGFGNCDACNGRGFVEIEGCPKVLVGPVLAAVMQHSAMARKGAFPEAGGTLDQMRWFIEAHQFIEGERGQIESDQLDRQKAKWQKRT